MANGIQPPVTADVAGKPWFGRCEMKRSPFAFVGTGHLAEDLRVHGAGIHTPGQQVAMVAVGGERKVAFFEQSERRDARCFLTDIDVEVTDIRDRGRA